MLVLSVLKKSVALRRQRVYPLLIPYPTPSYEVLASSSTVGCGERVEGDKHWQLPGRQLLGCHNGDPQTSVDQDVVDLPTRSWLHFIQGSQKVFAEM